MATPISGSLGQTNNYSSITELITQWPTAAQNQGIQLSGIAFDEVETNYTNPTVISNLTLATNDNPKSGLSYGGMAGIGVPGSYSGWFTDVNKLRAEINHDPNTNQSQVLKVKWADNQDITSATIGVSGLLPKSSSAVDDQGNEVGVLQLFKDGALVSPSNFTITPLNPPNPQKLIVSSNAVTFIGDRIDGNFTFQIVGNSLTGVTFDELRFSAQSYDSPTVDYATTPFKSDGSDYLVRNIEYQGISVPPTPTPTPTPTSPSLFQFQQPNYTVAEGGVATINVTRTGGTGAASINYATVDGSASSAGSTPDYTSATGVLSFAAGQTTANFTVTALSDLILESPETVNLVLFGGNVSSPSLLTINDVPPSGGTTPPPTPTPGTTTTLGNTYFFGATNYSVPEGSAASITINRSGNLSVPGTITFSTGGGSAQSTPPQADYSSVFLTVQFAAGQTSVQVPVPTFTDPLTEPTETVGLFLSGGTLGSPSLAVLSIIDTTPPPSFFYGSSPGAINDAGFSTFTINRNGDASVGTSVDYFILPPGPGQPQYNQDYTINTGTSVANTPTGGRVTFGPGVTSVTLTMNNNFGLTGGPVTLGFGPGVNVGNPPFIGITLL